MANPGAAETPTSLVGRRPARYSGKERRSRSRRLFDAFVLSVQVMTVSVVALVAIIVVAVTAGPQFFPYQTYYVLTGSMDPAMPIGTLVISTATDAANLRTGDVITFHRPDGGNVPVTHRIVAIEKTPEGTRFATKGDANQLADPWRVPADSNPALVRISVPVLGNLVRLLQNPIVRLLVIAAPTLLIGSLMLLELTQVRKRKNPAGAFDAGMLRIEPPKDQPRAA